MTDSLDTQPLDPVKQRTEALITAHTDHLLEQMRTPAMVEAETTAFFDWLREQPLSRWLALSDLQALFQQQAAQPTSDELVEAASAAMQTALEHPINAETPLQALVTERTIEQVAKLIGKQRTLRERLIRQVLGNPAYGHMLSQTISVAVSDYMSNSVGKKVPGMGGLMKFGKSAFEKVTDSNLDNALENYLKRNIEGLIETSQRKLIEQLTDEKIEQLILNSWNRSKHRKLAQVFETEGNASQEISEEAPVIAHSAWNHLKQTQFVQVQVQDGLRHWYERYSDHSPVELLDAVGITTELMQAEVHQLARPLINLLADSDYFRARIEARLRAFYTLPEIQAILS